jgi:hypothetical protein
MARAAAGGATDFGTFQVADRVGMEQLAEQTVETIAPVSISPA